MPRKNVYKEFAEDTIYHVYNRGVEKRIIFQDAQDYDVFLGFLKYALLTNPYEYSKGIIDIKDASEAQRFTMRRLGLCGEVALISYCLMPNHFHLVLYQQTADGVTKLMRSVSTGYAMYFNKRYKRVGGLFESRYKARRIMTDEDLLHITRYVHLNALDVAADYKHYPYSSFECFTPKKEIKWLSPGYVLGLFPGSHEYERFCDSYIPYRNDLKRIKNILANDD